MFIILLLLSFIVVIVSGAQTLIYTQGKMSLILLIAMLLLFFYFLLDCNDNAANQYVGTSSSIATCSPSYCVGVSNAAATDAKAGQTISNSYISTQLQDLGCKSCTQSTDDMCTSCSLSSVIKTGYGLKAAYCTNEYLVLMGTGKASHSDGLADIPRPPGEGGSNPYSAQSVTRSYHEEFAVWKIPVSTKRTDRTTSTSGVTDVNYIAMTSETDPTCFQTSNSAVVDLGMPTSGPVGTFISISSVYF